MNKTILLLTASVFLTGSLLISCNSPREKVENAEENVEEAKEDLKKANSDYLNDVELYRLETAERIKENEENIAEFNKRIETEKKEVRAEYKEKIDRLNTRNTDLKKIMDDYQADGKEGWETFKINFNRSMDELTEGFKNVFVPKEK